MKIKSWKSSAAFRSRISQESDAYLRGSLDTSFTLSDQLGNWSTSNDPKARRCAMRFHKKWRHPDCAVMGWYGLQTCTEFQSIQLWRNTDNQFLHEFLIILLTDGSACKVERMGEGLRADAIRRIGCSAYDLIQWFSTEDHSAKKWSQISQEMILQVDFPRTFDILDVLAVCYAMHEHARASAYTLQRYNCYFLCNTILVVLTRRVAEWETQVTEADWAILVDSAIDELKRTSTMLEEQYVFEYLSFGICGLLDPGNPDPAGFLLEPLRLDLKHRASHGITQKITDSLWYKHISVIVDGPILSKSVADAVKNDPPPNSAAFRLHTLLKEVNVESYPPSDVDIPSIHKTVSGELVTLCSNFSKEVADVVMSLYKMQEKEYKPPILLRLTASVLGPLACTIPLRLVAKVLKAKVNEFDGNGNLNSILSRFGVTLERLMSSVPLTARSDFAKTAFMLYNGHNPHDADIKVIHNDMALELHAALVEKIPRLLQKVAEHIFSILRTLLHTDSGRPDVLAAMVFLNNCFHIEVWGFCVEACLNRSIEVHLHKLLAHKSATIRVHSMNDTQVPKTEYTMTEFQATLQQRINAHAKRVESYKLAAAPLVQRDIERSMTQIWCSLPDGFGPRTVQKTPRSS